MGKTKATATTEVGKKAASLFADYPEAKELFFTSDGTAFFKECDAQNHACGLSDKTVTNVKK